MATAGVRPARIRAHAERFSRERFLTAMAAEIDALVAAPTRGRAMVKRWNRLLVAFFVLTDSLFGMIAFVLAYVIRFDTGPDRGTEGLPAASRSTSTSCR